MWISRQFLLDSTGALEGEALGSAEPEFELGSAADDTWGLGTRRSSHLRVCAEARRRPSLGGRQEGAGLVKQSGETRGGSGEEAHRCPITNEIDVLVTFCFQSAKGRVSFSLEAQGEQVITKPPRLAKEGN